MPRSRYTTALPSFIAVARDESPNVALSQAERPVQKLGPSVGLNAQDGAKPIPTHPADHMLAASPTWSRKQDVLALDSSLPYQRPSRINDTKNIAAQLIFIDQGSSFSSDQTSSHTADSRSDTSDSSNFYPNRHKSRETEIIKDKPVHELRIESSPDGSESEMPNGQESNISPLRHRANDNHDVTTFTPRPVTLPETSQAPLIPLKNPNRTNPSSPKSPQSSSVGSPNRAAPSIREMRNTPGQTSSELNALHVRPLNLTGKAPSERRSVLSSSRPRSPDPDDDVVYENVEGVELDTQPAAVPERLTGLSLPEIEARDIRQIPVPEHQHTYNEQNNDPDSASQTSFVHGSSLSSAVNSQTNTHTVSPRAVPEGEGYLAQNVDSQAYGEDPASLSESPEIPSTMPTEGIESPRPRSKPHIPRHSQTSGTRGSFDTPTTILEDSREDLLDIVSNDVEGSAEAPTIGFNKEFEERDSKMTRGIETAKSLISKML